MPYSDPIKASEYRRGYYLRNKEKQIEQTREYYYSHHDARKAQKKLWAEKNKEKLKEYRKSYAVAYRLRKVKEQHARGLVHTAIRNGSLKREDICSECHLTGLIHAHHNDYDKPLEVEWLCHQCHFDKHLKKKGGEL